MNTGRGFIAFGLYDTVFFLLAPVIALGLVGLVAAIPAVPVISRIIPDPIGPSIFAMLVLSQGHAVAVFFRSHGNRSIFVRHRFAFIAVPALLFLGLMVSDWVMAGALVLAPFWAVYHLGMQNFGIGRMYDVRWGNPADMGRSLDYVLHQFFNVAPFLAGWSLLPHLQSLRGFDRVGWHAPSQWLVAHRSIEGALAGLFLVTGPLFLAFYLYSYRRLVRRHGYRVSPQKTVLLVNTGVVSVVSWGFLAPWKAVFVVNLFHSVQYFALVWWVERANLGRVTRLERTPFGRPLLLVAFASITVLLGGFLQTYGRDYAVIRWAASLALVISLMHYWYDGFVWSVQRREV
ncbi:MAG: hypothetical protein ACI91F_001176 [Candidatus Binatia bacterium]|jgi:hypothetical protein